MAQQTIEIGQQTPIAAASALKKAGYGVTSGGKPVNVSENNDVDNMLDIFPELNELQPQKGGEVKDIKPKEKREVKIKLNKEIVPKKVNRDPKMESIMTKKEVLEVINAGGSPSTTPAPSKPAPSTPTIAPGKPGQRPERQNPFRPKPGVNPNPKASTLPDWLQSKSLGLGENNDIMEIRSLIKKII